MCNDERPGYRVSGVRLAQLVGDKHNIRRL